MRKALVAASAALFCMSTTAYAADIYQGSLKDDPVVHHPAPKTWTGLYLGAGVGAGAVVHELDAYARRKGNKCEENGDYVALAEGGQCSNGGGTRESGLIFDGIGGEGAFGTLQLGYDRQLSSRFVIGAFLDYDFSNISTDLEIYNNYNSYSAEIELEHMWSIGARFGWLATPDTMWYVLAAYTQGSFDVSDSEGFLADYLKIDDFDGYTLGAGVETRLTDNWSIKGEYRFTQFDSETILNYGHDEGPYSYEAGVDLEPSVHTARVVLSYRINPFERSLDSYK